MLARSCFCSARLLAKCRKDPGASRILRCFCNASLLLSPRTGRKWRFWPRVLASRSDCSLDLAPGCGRCAINVPELGCERSALLKLVAWIRSPPVEQLGFKPFSKRVALSQCFTRAESPNKSKCFKATAYLENTDVFYFLCHYSVLHQRVLTAPVFKLGGTNARYSAVDFLRSLSVRAMEAVASKTLEEDNTLMSMDCDQSNEELQLVLTPESDAASVKDSLAMTGWLFSDANAKQLLQNDAPEGTQQTEDTKKKLRPRKRKKNLSSAKNEINSLLAELPFSQAEIREEYGFTTAPEKTSKKKRKRTLGGENDDDAGQKKKKKAHPNYFVSIPITNPKIVDGIKAVQDITVQTDEKFSKAMIPVSCLHVTLLAIYLANEMEVNKAVNAIEECKETVQEILQGKQLALRFQGIADFRCEVVFVQLLQNEHLTTLTQIAETVKTRFQANGILTGDSKAFKPHLTFMKLSRAPKLRHQGIKKFSPEVYKNFEDHYFGDEIVTCLQLCSMLKKKQPNGYYHCETSVTVGKKRDSDVIRNALQKETITVLCKLNQIKELLSHPGTQIRIQREMAVKSTALH
ncbi:A-kinase anchor protein 7-like isoform X2 [Heterodontus francisci]|uniref:A-kinase anchor protein 7-like isoform X2 n=1 Tax=Heterodontus francisci TaxID=7792 RepID=UPI00355BB4BE